MYFIFEVEIIFLLFQFLQFRQLLRWHLLLHNRSLHLLHRFRLFQPFLQPQL
jgi:hypothetical protein